MRKNWIASLALFAALFAIVTNPGTLTFAQNVLNYMDQGGAFWHVGGTLQVESGGVLNIAAGGALKQGGTAYKFARGQATTATASDTIVTGLTTVVAVVCNMDDSPTTDPEIATCSIGDQAGSPAAGSILVKTWKTLGGTPAAATTFSKKVNWIAIGS